MSDNKLIKGGDYNLSILNLITGNDEFIDISPYMVTVDVYENIYYPYVTATILVDDTDGLMEYAMIMGNEKIQLKFSTGDGFAYMDKVFDIYTMTDVVGSKGQTYYKLWCITYLSNVNNNTRISKSYNGYANTIVEKIMRQTMDYKGKLVLEPVKYSKSFVCPNWKPLRLINYLAYSSISNNSDTDGEVGYVFFENRDGYNFVTIDTLFSKDSTHVLKDMQSHTGGEIEFNQVKKLDIPVQYDVLSNQLSGTYGNKTFTHSIVNKSYKAKSYVNKNNRSTAMYSDNNVIAMFPVNDFSSEVDIYGNLHRAKINEYKTFNITVALHGNSNITVGDNINYTIASRQDVNGLSSHSLYPTKHIVTKHRHTISMVGDEVGYESVLELSSKEWK